MAIGIGPDIDFAGYWESDYTAIAKRVINHAWPRALEE